MRRLTIHFRKIPLRYGKWAVHRQRERRRVGSKKRRDCRFRDYF